MEENGNKLSALFQKSENTADLRPGEVIWKQEKFFKLLTLTCRQDDCDRWKLLEQNIIAGMELSRVIGNNKLKFAIEDFEADENMKLEFLLESSSVYTTKEQIAIVYRRRR